MIARWPCMVVALLCLLAIATSAYAGGAWVLWSDVGTARGAKPAWGMIGATETKRECEEDGARLASHLVEKMQRSPKEAIYLCLPVGVDPPGPKTKRSGGER